MSIYTLTDAIVIGQGVEANALAALASGLMGCNAGGGSFGVRVECSVFEKYNASEMLLNNQHAQALRAIALNLVMRMITEVRHEYVLPQIVDSLTLNLIVG